MKTIILLILSAFTAFAATTYPVMTDNPLRTFTGGATNLALLNGTNRFVGPLQLPSVTAGRVPIIDVGGNLTNSSVTSTTLGYLDATSSVQTQLDSKPTVALTNLALLNGTNVFTGTNTFEAAKFFPANNIGMRLLWTSPTNIYISSVAVVASNATTNNGDYVNTTHFGYGDIPPLLSSNSFLVLYGTIVRSNANLSSAVLHAFIGPNTNWIGYVSVMTTGAGNGNLNTTTLLMPGGGTTNWVQGANFASGPLIIGPTNFFDSTITNKIYFGLTTTTSHTNVQVFGFRLYECYAP